MRFSYRNSRVELGAWIVSPSAFNASIKTKHFFSSPGATMLESSNKFYIGSSTASPPTTMETASEDGAARPGCFLGPEFRDSYFHIPVSIIAKLDNRNVHERRCHFTSSAAVKPQPPTLV